MTVTAAKKLKVSMPVLMPEFNRYFDTKAAWDSNFTSWSTFMKPPKLNQVQLPGGIKAPEIKLSLKNSIAKDQFAMMPGMLCYLRMGDQLTDGVFSFIAKVPTIVVKTLPENEMAKLAKVMPIPSYVIYENIDPDQLRKDLASANGPIDRKLDVQRLVLKILQRKSLISGLGTTVDPDFKKKLTEKLRKLIISRMTRLLIPAVAEQRRGVATIKVLAGEKIGAFKGDLVVRLVKLNKIKGSGTTVSYIDPSQCMKAWSMIEKKLEKHPLSTWAIGRKESIRIYLRFEYWSESQKKYVAVDWKPNVGIKINNNIPLLPTVSSLKKSGDIELVIPKGRYQDVVGAKLFFVVDLNEHMIGTVKFPKQWQSTGKYDVNGMPGFFETFKGVNLGSKQEPLVFRLGARIHLQLQYKDGYRKAYDRQIKDLGSIKLTRFLGISLKRKNLYGNLRRFPEGVKVRISGLKNTVSFVRRTDGKGVVDCWVAEDGFEKMEITLIADMEVAASGLKQVTVVNENLSSSNISSAKPISWKTKVYLTRGVNEIVGDRPGTPRILKVPDSDHLYMFRNAVFTLKKVMDMHNWLRYMTKGSAASAPLWQAKPLTIGLHHEASNWYRGITSNAKIIGTKLAINIYVDPKIKMVPLRTIAHEYGHYVQSVAWKSNETVWIRVARSLGFYPHSKKVINEFTALIEGWAPFFSLVFDHKSYDPPPRKFSLSRNSGEKIEDSVAVSFFDLYQHEVLPSSVKEKTMGDSENGDITRIPHSYCDGRNYYPNFNQYIWTPFTQLAPYFHSWGTAPPAIGIRQFCKNISSIPANRTLWRTRLRRHFHRRNIVRDL